MEKYKRSKIYTRITAANQHMNLILALIDKQHPEPVLESYVKDVLKALAALKLYVSHESDQ